MAVWLSGLGYLMMNVKVQILERRNHKGWNPRALTLTTIKSRHFVRSVVIIGYLTFSNAVTKHDFDLISSYTDPSIRMPKTVAFYNNTARPNLQRKRFSMCLMLAHSYKILLLFRLPSSE